MFFSKKTNEKKPTLKWESILNEGAAIATARTKVVGGWLVCCQVGADAAGTTFIPDPKHEWDGYSVGYEHQEDDVIEGKCTICKKPTINKQNGKYLCGWCELLRTS